MVLKCRTDWILSCRDAYYSISLNTGHGRFYANLGRYPGQDEDNLFAVIEQTRRGQGA